MLGILLGMPLLLGSLGYAIGRASDRRWAVWILPLFLAVLFSSWILTTLSIGAIALYLWAAGAGALGTHLGQRAREKSGRRRETADRESR